MRSVLLAALLAAAAAAGEGPPNIVLLVADDLGYGDLGVQGAADLSTPHIDSLARDGVRFPSGYVSGPVCAPTRAGLLTGRYPQRFGFEFNPPEARAQDYGLPVEEPTLAERLKEKGYRTGMVGKWHLGFRAELTPPRRGFEEFFGFLSGMRSYFPRAKADPILRGDKPVEEREYLTTAFGREAAEFVERHRGEPFFLYVAFNSVHAPLEATDADLARFPHVAGKRRTYAAMVASMDDAVGVLLAKLRDCGLEERTLVFFLSDNGGPTRETGARNRPLKGRKGQVYEGGIRTPFLMRWKGRLRAGRVYEEPVISLDVAATALAAAGAGVPKELDGVDLLPHLEGRSAKPPHAALYWRYGEQSAVRAGDWKLVVRKGKEELFHLGRDPGEDRDLIAEEPERAKALREAHAKWQEGLEAPRWHGKD